MATSPGSRLPPAHAHGNRAIRSPAVADLGPHLFGRDSTARGPAPPLRARVLPIAVGETDLEAIAADVDQWLGLLILDGLLLVTLDAGRAHTGWLVGAGDLIQPWRMGEISLTNATDWRALTVTRLALLDREFGVRTGGVPFLARALVERTAQTTHWLLAHSLVLASPVVEERLLLAFALLAERWGTVNPDGVLLRIPLTHALLATLCGVRRPSVTLALQSLASAGIVTRTGDGDWLLHRCSAKGLNHLPSCWPQYANVVGLPPAAVVA